MTRLIAGAGAMGCFLGHTMVRVPDGTKRIDALMAGDLVIAFDDTGELHQAKVLAVHQHQDQPVHRYRLWGGNLLDATPNHWVLNQFNAFVEIGSLGPDDCLVDENNHLRPIVAVAPLARATVWNLTVEGHHTFIAGGIRVHNAGLGGGVISGAGGGAQAAAKGVGGKAPRDPETDRDNLDSRQYVALVDLISEGEIQGVVGGAKGIYLDNTALENPDGSRNFQNVQVDFRTGTQNQTFIPLAGDVSNEVPVGVLVEENTPLVRTITDPTVQAARITLSFPQLQWAQSDGDIRGVSVRLRIQVQYNGGGYATVVEDTVSGRTADLYQRDYRISLLGAKPCDIKVVRLSEDSTDPVYVDAFQWTSYTELTYGRLKYPNSALVAMRVNAEQFSSIPARTYRVRGIKVKVPNAVIAVDQANGRLIYNTSTPWTGVWNPPVWTTDPAWILYDLLINKRYGFGDHIAESQLDKWAFFTASLYCSELVPDGFGGVEPRFSCNVSIQTAEDAYKLIGDMASVFRAMPFWASGAITISQDRPTDTAYLFTLANVQEGGFTYQTSSLKQRPTVAVVSYLDPVTRDVAYESVEDQAAIARYGVITTEISAFACTSRGQAHRLGEWLLYAEQYETEVVSFATSIEAGVVVRPGQVIEIADPMRAGSRRGGRITAATATTITVDSTEGITALSSGTLSVVMPDGTVQSRSVASKVGSVVTVTAAFTTTPNVNSVWIWQTNDLQTSTWRVLGVKEDEASYSITALSYNASKYNFVERGIPLQFRDATNLNVIPPAPAGLSAKEVLYENNGQALVKIMLSWQSVPGVLNYRVRYRYGNDNWVTVPARSALDYEILNSLPGSYLIEVYSLNAANFPSVAPARLTLTTFGKTAPPADVTGLSLVPIDEASAILSWDRVADLDVVLGGKILIRHSNVLSGALWERSQDVVAAAAGSQTQKQVPLLEGTYLVKAEDDGGRRSANAITVITDLPTPQPRLLVIGYQEHLDTPPFNGTATGMFYTSELAGLVIDGGTLVDDMALDGNWDGLPSVDSVGGVNAGGSYVFENTLDLGGIFDVNIRRQLATVPYVAGGLIDDKLTEIDTWGLIDEAAPDDVNAAAYVRMTQGDPAGSPMWGDWQDFSNAIVRARGMQFKLVATSGDPVHNIAVTELGSEVELQQRVEQSDGVLTSGTSTYTVTFTAPFYLAPQIGITANDMATGDYFAITSITRSSFQITFRNSAATIVSRQFTYAAVGYGREII